MLFQVWWDTGNWVHKLFSWNYLKACFTRFSQSSECLIFQSLSWIPFRVCWWSAVANNSTVVEHNGKQLSLLVRSLTGNQYFSDFHTASSGMSSNWRYHPSLVPGFWLEQKCKSVLLPLSPLPPSSTKRFQNYKAKGDTKVREEAWREAKNTDYDVDKGQYSWTLFTQRS